MNGHPFVAVVLALGLTTGVMALIPISSIFWPSSRGTQLTCDATDTLGEDRTQNYVINTVEYETSVTFIASDGRVQFSINSVLGSDTFTLRPPDIYTLDGGLTFGLLSSTSTTATFGFGCRFACAPAAETCNGQDDDCDGQVDEGCGCVHGQTRACGIATGNCVQGTETCAAGTWGSCIGSVGPVSEVCGNGQDEDCDGIDGICPPACADGIHNQDEAGPDCGGVCGRYWYNQSCHDNAAFVTRECGVCIDEVSRYIGWIEMPSNWTCAEYGQGDYHDWNVSTMHVTCVCEDECVAVGTIDCDVNKSGYGYRCGNYDRDACSERGDYVRGADCPVHTVCDELQCSENQYCVNGACQDALAACTELTKWGSIEDNLDVVFTFNISEGGTTADLLAELNMLHHEYGFFKTAPFREYARQFNIWYMPPELAPPSANSSAFAGMLDACPFANVGVIVLNDVTEVCGDGALACAQLGGPWLFWPRRRLRDWEWLLSIFENKAVRDKNLALAFTHEMGHVVGHLDDEYLTDYPPINTTCKPNPGDFERLLSVETVEYLECGDKTHYRNSPNSIMRNIYGAGGDGFNRVSLYYLEAELRAWT